MEGLRFSAKSKKATQRYIVLSGSGDKAVGMIAFAEKREGKWKGR